MKLAMTTRFWVRPPEDAFRIAFVVLGGIPHALLPWLEGDREVLALDLGSLV